MKRFITLGVLVCAMGWTSTEGHAEIRLPPIFSDHMVLQRDQGVRVWGWAPAGEKISVEVAGQKMSGVTDSTGAWRVSLAPVPAGGPYELMIRTSTEEKRVRDILFGDVWLASGQSNMIWPLKDSDGGATEAAAANANQIRLMKMDDVISPWRRDELSGGGWKALNPQDAAEFSAVAYYFGKLLGRELRVPIGLVQSAWGGTPIEAWMSEKALQPFPEFASDLKAFQQVNRQEFEKARSQYVEKITRWKKDFAAVIAANAHLGWEAPSLPNEAWKTMVLPQSWEKAGLPDMDGVVWFRKQVEIPAVWVGRDLHLHLGRVDDEDTTWVNGVQVGATEGWDIDRVYRVPASAVKGTSLVIAVRVVDKRLDGGINGEPEDMRLDGPGAPPVRLAGSWLYRVGAGMEKLGSQPVAPLFADNPGKPSVLFNGMVAPLASLPIRGVIWYQGESNTDRPLQYASLFPALINDWRAQWGRENLPFLFVQLAAFHNPKGSSDAGKWPLLREAQHRALTLPATGEAVTIDIGDPQNIHPKNKKDVGYRLASLALARVYGKRVPFSGPRVFAVTVERDRIRLRMDSMGSGLASRGGDLREFEIAGADRKFVPAQAWIQGDSVVVFSEAVPKPAAVRYAWSDAPEWPNLCNREGFPASPFSTDDELKR